MNNLNREQRGGETVLVVDDLAEQTSLAARILERAGYIVLAAHSGGEALLILENLEGAVDLLITDLRMPGMKGPDLARDVQTRYPSVRTLFVSGGALDPESLAGGIFLAKPYSSKDLLESVRLALAAEGPAEVSQGGPLAYD